MKRMRLGDILMEMGAVDELQLHAALAHQRHWGTPLGRTFIDKRFCTADQVLKALAKQTQLPIVDLDQQQLDPKLANLLTHKAAEQHRMVPLRLQGARDEELVVAIAGPATLASLDVARTVSRKARVAGVLASDNAIARAIHRLYGGPLPVAALERDAIVPGTPVDADAVDAAHAGHGRAGHVFLYGWPEVAAKNVLSALQRHGVEARIVGALLAQETSGRDIIIAPIPAMEALHRAGRAPKAKLIAAGKTPDYDLPRAHKLGARSFLLAPLDVEILVRAVRRCQDLSAPALLEASVA